MAAKPLFNLMPRFNERSDVEATTQLASEAMPTHNPYSPYTPFRPLANYSPQQLDKLKLAEYTYIVIQEVLVLQKH